jgi:hypothetical protein
MRREWRNVDKGIQYYFQSENGLIVGQVYNLTYTSIWGARIPLSATEEHVLGQYIELEFAKKAIEEYWSEKDRTLEMTNNYLLTSVDK